MGSEAKEVKVFWGDGGGDFPEHTTVTTMAALDYGNDGAGQFIQEFNCYQNVSSGRPYGVVASDFDLDGKTDLAIVATKTGGYDSLFALQYRQR